MISLKETTILVVGLLLLATIAYRPFEAQSQLVSQEPSLSDNDLYQVVDGQGQNSDAAESNGYLGLVRGAPATSDLLESDTLREARESDILRILDQAANAHTDERDNQRSEDQQVNEFNSGSAEDRRAALGSAASLYGRVNNLRDSNRHWPLTGSNRLDNEISPPVNDPEDFEARMGELTDELNYNIPNTAARQELLMTLVNHSTGLLNRMDSSKVVDPNSINQLERARIIRELTKLVADQEAADGAAQYNFVQSNDDETSEANNDDESETSTRYRGNSGTGSEYIDHPLALVGHQYVQGGAGEGRQLLGPDGTFENVQVIKTDTGIPSYCDPPNPCPIGYTAKDGCLEEFVNLASFSREYQAKQKCSCDNEHSLFNCASPMTSNEESQQEQQQQSLDSRDVPASDDNNGPDNDNDERNESPSFMRTSKLNTLARTIQNRFGDLASVQRLIGKHQLEEEQRIWVPQLASDEGSIPVGNDNDENSDYLIRSARKLSSLDMHHKTILD